MKQVQQVFIIVSNKWRLKGCDYLFIQIHTQLFTTERDFFGIGNCNISDVCVCSMIWAGQLL